MEKVIYEFPAIQRDMEDLIGMCNFPMEIMKMLFREDVFVEKIKHKTIQLLCKRVKFYALKDEDAFFEWIKKIKCIKNISAIGNELSLDLPHLISDDDLRDILALFYRYKIDMHQLFIFLNDTNKSWFYEGNKGYWYDNVFGD
jgi:hypothetical protein